MLLLAAVACGDEKGSASSKPLSRAQLSRAVLTQGDMPGYKISKKSGSGNRDLVRADKKSCQPIVNAMDPEALAYENRFAASHIIKNTEGSRAPTAEYILTISSVESASVAKRTVKDLKKAISACNSGFKTGSSGLASKVSSVTAGEVSLGDEGVEFSVEYQSSLKRRYAVTQKGASLTTIVAQHASWRRLVPVPQKIVDAQRQKLAETVK
ncbi:hypothetical protein [Streptomyces flavofungini]|uniref:hypothetical protein n=1 Tax=Streptomyces flavofungini TaxID=68200 RepID=UPI0025B06F35|nr:hypothetical protein [Streptomyces flavofungini]WJV46914.1 hypothetical protein QUY26_16090 [Streptomyces flavofungini]